MRGVRVAFDDVFRVVEAEVSYERADGTMSGIVRRLSFERGDSAAAVIVDPARKVVIFTRQFRYPAAATNDAWLLELAAGSVKKDESPQECIRRELVEELGYAVPSLTPITSFYVSPGGSSERVHLFYAEVGSSERVGPGGGIDDEEIEIVEIPIVDVPGLLADGSIVDAKTLIGLTWMMQTHPLPAT